MDIKDVTQFPEIAGLKIPSPSGGADRTTPERSFGNVLEDSLAEVTRLQQQADRSITDLATGDKTSVHDTMVAMEQASVSFQLMMQVRNKIVEAYQEIMRMQV